MTKIVPYFSVSNSLEAFDLYKKIFGAKLVAHNPATKDQAEVFGIPKNTDFSKTTMHMVFKIGTSTIYMADNFTNTVLDKANIAILVEPTSLEQAKKFSERAEKFGCTITNKLEKQFWGDYFGTFKDPFGIRWQLNFSPKK